MTPLVGPTGIAKAAQLGLEPQATEARADTPSGPVRSDEHRLDYGCVDWFMYREVGQCALAASAASTPGGTGSRQTLVEYPERPL